jgi:hypothetical protein
LRGPRRRRTDLLNELRDSLGDTAAAYVAAGMSVDEAERRAVAESGVVAELVPAYQSELAADQSKRTAMLLALVMPANYLAWNVLWRTEDAPAWDPSGLYRFLSEATDYLGLAGGTIAIAGLVALVWFARTGRDTDLLVRGLVGVETALIAVMVVSAIGMNLVDTGQTQSAVEAVGYPVTIVGLLTMAALVLQARALWRTFIALPRQPALAA